MNFEDEASGSFRLIQLRAVCALWSEFALANGNGWAIKKVFFLFFFCLEAVTHAKSPLLASIRANCLANLSIAWIESIRRKRVRIC
jgi:hypothetical protein